jgi:aerobic carbon-monoxide dehydrogenase large subunit
MSLPAVMEPDLAATAYFNCNALTFAYGANACEVEIDPETGDVRVVRYIVVHDCGKLI